MAHVLAAAMQLAGATYLAGLSSHILSSGDSPIPMWPPLYQHCVLRWQPLHLKHQQDHQQQVEAQLTMSWSMLRRL